ncbi:HAD-IA family hydrolase [Actinacidiphila glaucinigra]|uniref:HAD-IA family hydrolase n=1 Tax=Actinacidiphila glaucinigra TaxID=235986 RepID=UPI0035DA9D38
MTARKGLILDFGGVLTTPLLPSVTEFERQVGLEEGRVIRQLYLDPEFVQLTEGLERGSVTQEQWNEMAASHLGVDDDNLMGRIFAGLQPEPLMLQAAATARRHGIRVGVLSNSVGMKPWDLYDGYDLDTAFDAVVISEQHGLRKPEKEIYELTLRMLELPGNECVFVDDTQPYLAPAADLGMATVLAGDPKDTVRYLQDALGIDLLP